MQETLRPYTINYYPSDIERADRIVERSPEYENNRSRLHRQALRELIDRKERELAERESSTEVVAA